MTDDEYKKVFESLLATLHDKFVFGIHQVMYNKIFDNKYLFDKMPDEAKRNVINSLLKFMNISKNQLGAVGKIGGKVNGVLYGFKTETEKGTSAGQLISNGKMQPHDIFIFQSPTGIFERRVTVAELANVIKDE